MCIKKYSIWTNTVSLLGDQFSPLDDFESMNIWGKKYPTSQLLALPPFVHWGHRPNKGGGNPSLLYLTILSGC